MTDAELTEALRGEAADSGFDRIGVARAGPLDRDAARLEAWLHDGRHAGMTWLARDPERRADPARLLPGCRSVICLAVNYWRPDVASDGGRAARVARYARGRDYHRTLGRAARRLAGWLDARSGATSRSFVDSGPVLERGWAERAGLGWIGKNANLIRRDVGSWLLLAEILTTARLVPDPGPHEDFCGTCNACVQACPTRAIVADGVVDSNRCISYWTIEHRGPIPAAMRAGLGEWIFGCDVCQEVCPWNETFATPGRDGAFESRDGLAGLDPADIAGMNERDFRARYSGTPLMRAKWEGMRRNAVVVLGNRRDASAVDLLVGLLDDPDPVIRGHAAWALGRIGGGPSRRALERRAPGEGDAAVREEIRCALGD